MHHSGGTKAEVSGKAGSGLGQRLTGILASVAIGWSLFSPIAASASEPARYQFTSANLHLNLEVLTDKLVHFEWALGSEATPVSRPLPVTPYVSRTDYGGPAEIMVRGNVLETKNLKLTVDASSTCIAVYDKDAGAALTSVCPTVSHLGLEGLSVARGAMKNVYGLGEQFRTPGVTNGDLAGAVRTPGNPMGNALVGYEGGAVGNAQFPVMYAVGPGTLNYALFLDHTRAQKWDFTSDPWKVQTSGRTLRGYIIGGRNLPELRMQYMDLVGRPLVPPKKAFGLWVSQFGYRDWNDIEARLKTLREHHFPVDGFVLDIFWFGDFVPYSSNNNFGRMEFDQSHFPDPKSKLDALWANEGLGIATIEEAYVDSNVPEYSVLSGKGYFVKDASGKPASFSNWWGHGSMIDWSNPAAAAFWHDWKRQSLIDDGVTIHWTDLAEPEEYLETDRYQGAAGLDGNTEADLHNVFSLLWSKSIAEGYARHHVPRRQFILARSGGPGIERYGTAMWSGDIGSNLKSLAAHLNAQMELSMSGLDYFGSDIGGFHRTALQGDLNEMYTKWFAHSSLFDVPVRPHTDDGNGQNNTPPDRIGDMKSNLFNIRQRYRLAPYYYSLAYRAHLYGEPVIPPLVYYYQADPNVRTIADEKLIGRSLLAATAAKDGETERRVYLPAGTWADVHTHQWIDSRGQWLDNVPEYQDGLFRLPLYARSGAIIPEMRVDDSTMNILGMRMDRKRDTDLIVRVFPSADFSGFVLYEDDGVTPDYQSGAFARTVVTQELGNQSETMAETVAVLPRIGTYEGAPAERSNVVKLELRNQNVSAVTLNGLPLTRYESKDQFEMAEDGWYQDGPVVTAKTVPLDVSITKIFNFDLK